MTGKDYAAIEKEFEGKGYGDFKMAVAESINATFGPIQMEYARILADKTYLDSVLKNGSERAAHIAARTLNKVYKKVGYLQFD